MELRDIYDIDRIPQGRTSLRGDEIQDGDYIMVVHACIFDASGRMLIQQRHKTKKAWGGCWDVSVGGAAIAGESSRDAIAREMLEELGLKLDFSALRPSMTFNFDHGFDDFYLLCMEPDIASLTLQSDEVADVRWANMDEIFRMLDEGSFIPYFKSVIALLFDCRGRSDCLNM